MSQAARVARVALRELWMTFRLLGILVAFVGGSAVVVLIPTAPAVTLDRVAIGLGVATVAASAVAAWTIADERAAGRAGWLITRSVSRATYVGGWLGSFALIALIGISASATLGWLTTLGMPVQPDLATYGIAVLAVAATAAAAIALGLAVGALLAPIPAALAAAATCILTGVAVVVASGGSSSVPGAAYLLLSRLADTDSALTDAMRAAGVGLIQTAVLFVVARAAMERAEL